MIEVEMTKDIREYEPKTFGFFTTRQMVWSVIGLLLAFLLFKFVPASFDVRIVLAFVGFSPAVFFGFTKGGEINMSDYLKLIIAQTFDSKKRLNKTINSYEFLADPPSKRKKTRKSAKYPRVNK